MSTCGHPALRKFDGYCGGCAQALIRDKQRAEKALLELVEWCEEQSRLATLEAAEHKGDPIAQLGHNAAAAIYGEVAKHAKGQD